MTTVSKAAAAAAAAVLEFIGDKADFESQVSSYDSSTLLIVDFSATWCGPCQKIKPLFHQMAVSSQANDNNMKNVIFIEIDEGKNKALISQLGIKGFPTFSFYQNAVKIDEIVGANSTAVILDKIQLYRKDKPMSSFGHILGSSSVNSTTTTSSSSAMDEGALREARLRKLLGASANGAIPPSMPGLSEQMSEDEQLAKAMALSQEDMVVGSVSKADEMVVEDQVKESKPVAEEIPIDQNLLDQLIDMGFPDLHAKKSVLATNGGPLEGCVQWLEAHQDDNDIDEPIKFVDLSKENKTELTEEEKTAKIAELKERIEKRRIEKAKEEVAHEQMSEIQRRDMGKQMGAAREEIDAIQRKHEAAKRKKEKEDTKRERERLRKEIEKDKAERAARGGKLFGGRQTTSVAETSKANVQQGKTSTSPPKPKLSPEEEVVDNIEKLKKYRVANDGLTAIKTLNVYVKNLIEKPQEEKFRTINLSNAAFKKRVGSLIGGIGFLKALGYEKDEETQMLTLAISNRDENLLKLSLQKLKEAMDVLS